MVIFKSEDQSSESAEGSPEVIVYDNSNIQKSCSGVTTPLTYHFTKRAFSSVFKSTLKQLSLSERSVSKDEDTFQNLVGLIKGRIFYNINSWYRGLQFFHSFDHNKSSLSQILGLSEPVTFIDTDQKSWWQKCILLWGRLIDLPRLLLAFSSLKAKVPAFLNAMDKLVAEFHQQDLTALSLEDLKREKARVDRYLLKHWTTPVLNDIYVLMASGNVAERLERAGLNAF
jgi:pyruvate,water dikinase